MKNVLFIGMNFYLYEKNIIKKLSNRYQVYYFVDKKDFFLDHFHIKRSEQKRKEIIKKYQQKELKKIEDVELDYVFVLVGRYLQRDFLEVIKKRNLNCKFILYLWDDVKRVNNFNEVRDIYDRIISFDPKDASENNFEFVPLMYNELNIINSQMNYDIYSLMYIHSDRVNIAKKIAETQGIKCNLIFKCPLKIAFINAIHFFNSNQYRGLKFKKRNVAYRKVIEDMQKSKSILDIQFPSQIGLTMRTFDVMSVGRKMITTNASIIYYDFYNPNNICIIERDTPIVQREFLNNSYEAINDTILYKYSLDNWVRVIFDGKSEKYLKDNNPWGL